MFKSGYVAIIGRPNVGKSTLMNNLMGEKLSIVSPRPQTTRNNIQTILTKKDFQIIFVDTPGMHKPKHKLGEFMMKSVSDSLKDVDLVVFMTTADGELGPGDKHILEDLKKVNSKKFLVVNKIDETKAETVAETLQVVGELVEFDEIIPISALNGKNTDKLLELMVDYLPEGPMYYPEDMITDAQERFIVSEIIREKALRLLSQEVPHGIAVEIVSMKQDKKNTYHIDVNMICEKDSHKGIIVGKGGLMMKKIATYAREDIEKLLGEKVDLKVWVKVRKEWRDNPNLLRELGYKMNK
ncbi:GTPase Era [Clostridium cellulovorans]|uniref:GTPase Era n=1 Tax=Clostridium cellulovorans (strain ATCC 35296 / DSM 3052 / OCM 3 / 743B) TaxID=573061 RepID=D9SW59_CLOC7|nr:GTPase Era [Clostridium cellulovorans]ADL51203.1 GTP-binding protein Era [Clostridium cellulovorans 743B]